MKRSLRLLLLVLMAVCLASAALAAEKTPARDGLFMKDGQFKHRLVEVFVAGSSIDWSQEPRLYLPGSASEGKLTAFAPRAIASNQQREHRVEGNKMTLTGAVLLFDLSSVEIPFWQSVRRATPLLSWRDAPAAAGAEGGTAAPCGVEDPRKECRLVTSATEVNLANPVGTYLLTMLLMAVLLYLVRRTAGTFSALLAGEKGAISLSRLQVALWTVAVGSVVFGYGMIRHETPEIPASLLALMGLSLATGALSYISPAGKGGESAEPPAPNLGWRALIMDASATPPQISIARAQMLFWTILMLVLFFLKSALEGVVWEVPWEMVTLMGMSQAGYLGPKFNTSPRGGATPTPPGEI